MIPLQAIEKCDIPNQISHICETWWHQERPGREQLTPQTISYLLVRVLEDNKVVDAQRLYNFRAALLIIDFGDERFVVQFSL